jgi:hypothetical protein
MTADDWIDPTKGRRAARKVTGDPRQTGKMRSHPPKPARVRGFAASTLEKKYQTMAAKYSELAKQARAADWDDVYMLGSNRSEPIPSETVYTLMADMARMIVRDLKESAKV